ncbi:MAG TPA: hypothetical protein VF655_00120 [Allosphingosinicella sp.]|jgi:ATP-dependent HslUV protease subunit HslV
MTTIACTSAGMAGDGRIMRGSIIAAESAVKVHRLEDGTLVGCAGQTLDSMAFRDWLAGGEEGKRPKASSPFGALVFKPDETLWYYADGSSGAIVDTPMAIGSGSELAMGAMLAGADAEQAVKVAARVDPYTGGRITVHLVGR